MKILVLGDSSVGKTSLINKYVMKSSTQAYKPTVGADFHNKKIQVIDPVDNIAKNV